MSDDLNFVFVPWNIRVHRQELCCSLYSSISWHTPLGAGNWPTHLLDCEPSEERHDVVEILMRA